MRVGGITRGMDELGRIVIPSEIRRMLDLGKNDPIDIFVEDDRIILQKYICGCHFCNKTAGLRDIHGKKICVECITKMVELI